MALDHGVILVLYALATAIGVTLGGYVLRYRDRAGAVPLALVLFGSVFVSGPRFVATAVDSYAVSVLMERLLYVGIGVSVLAGVLLVLEYTGREHLVTRTTVGLLAIEPILTVGFAAVNPGNLFFESLEPDPTVPTGVAVEWGVAFGVHAVYSYLLMTAITLMILEFLYTSRGLYRGQAAALLGAAILPWFANAVHVVGLVDADTTPIGYVLLGTLYAVAIVRYQLIDVVPIARDRVLDTISEGVLVVDLEDRLIDVNPAGRAMLDPDPERTVIGRDVRRLFADDTDIVDRYRELTATPETDSAELTYDDRHFEVRTTPIDDDRDRHVGWLALVYDITDRKRREATLERQNERLEGFASLVSHDLRNPLTVADGYLELARESDDPDEEYLERIDRAHDRMETIIGDVLALAREGSTVTDPEAVGFEELADRAWESVETVDASLTVETDEIFRADPGRSCRLLENLFRNAIEHGSTGPESGTRRNGTGPLEITVGAIESAEDGSIEGFYVADDGVGIPPDHSERIFEDGFSTDEDGTGLGLSIVEEIADAHGWSISVTESESGGARFECTGVEAVDTEDRRTARGPTGTDD